MYRRIESPNNPSIKQLFQLREKSRTRKKEARFIIEGIQEIQLALEANYQLTDIYVCADIIAIEKFENIFQNYLHNLQITEISIEVYQKLAYRTTTEGVIGVSKIKKTSLSELHLHKNPLILVAEAPEKPGNIGALLRTADAANVDAVLIANPKTDLFNPNIIRSSVGCVFTNTIATGTTDEIITFLKEKKINSYGATLQSSAPYHIQDYTKPTAIVVGTEHEGLSEIWRINTTQNIIIPMSGSVDSMNVSVAAGILIFEAKRQRGF
ncbi:TrmH family RNA methyltransferase [Aquimarina agarilytica]|uniref:TrmH family RNA methyltransferase n=1 Tax=Aquimarina agarilytica TaxID=1087449 RepID=UPI000289BE35|nr:RNA methyltransferase [Aquimarina agarilytica]